MADVIGIRKEPGKMEDPSDRSSARTVGLFVVLVILVNGLIAPMIWPWMRADTLRRGRTHGVWPLLCLALAAAWIGLGYLGSRPADYVTIRATQALAAFYLCFFLMLPLLVGKIAGRIQA